MSMTEREILELAAKAAGLHVIGRRDEGLLIRSDGCKTGYDWNPRNDDGDALRLAVKLDIHIHPCSDEKETLCWFVQSEPITELYNDDPYAATRRAIVRAAAEVGKAMKG